jgi:hypothetical protein
MNSCRKAFILFITFPMLLVAQVLQSQVFYTSFEPDEPLAYWQNARPVADSAAVSGYHVNRIEENHLYAQGLRYPVADSLFHCNISISFSGWFRFASQPQDAIYVISLLRHDSLVYWYGIRLANYIDSLNHWCHVETSINIPSNYVLNGTLNAYVWNQSKETFDMDDVSFSIQRMDIESFMPAIVQSAAADMPKVLTQNHFYELLYFPRSGSLIIADKRGRHLTLPLQLYAAYYDQGVSVEVNSKWRFVGQKHYGDHILTGLRHNASWGVVNLILETDFHSPKIHFMIEERLRAPKRWKRRTLVIPFYDDVEKVMRKNSLEDDHFIQPEYYLDRQGVVIGSGSRSLSLYHLSGVSSAQLQTKTRELLVNLDYEKDHPMLHFPLMPDTTDFFIDVSAALNSWGERFSHAFSIYVGNAIEKLPRFMPVPLGYEAAMIWTEHADWTDIRTHRAVNFGHEDIHSASDAIAGFVKYEIPVTKSVFYNNPDSITNNEASGGIFTGLHATLRTDTAFMALTRQLHLLGHDICLHTPEQYTSTQNNLQEALQFMQHEFGSPTWIDHGYNNKPHNNRENLVCDGLLPRSAQYARNLWNTYGIRYFWNPYIEEVNPYVHWGFNGQLILPYPGFGDAFPDRIITRHPAFEEALLWSTTGTLEVQQERFWDYLFHPSRLQGLVEHRSIYINHIYPAWVAEGKGFWQFNEEGKVVAQQGFNNALQRIAEMRDRRLIQTTTIAELLAYYEAVWQLEYHVIDSETVKIVNPGSQSISGLSLAVSTNNVEVNGSAPEMKKSGTDTIFWFKLEPGEEAIIRFW